MFSQHELARTGMGTFQLGWNGLATSSSRAGGMSVPLYPPGYSSLPYKLGKKRPKPSGLTISNSLPMIRPTTAAPLRSSFVRPNPYGNTLRLGAGASYESLYATLQPANHQIAPVHLERARSAARLIPAPATPAAPSVPATVAIEPKKVGLPPRAGSAKPSPSKPGPTFAEQVAMAAAPPPSVPKVRAKSAAPKVKPSKASVAAVREQAGIAMNNRFSDLFRAFKYLDVDNSGFISADELSRTLSLWNVDHSPEQVQELVNAVDNNGDGQVSYAEFVQALARDTVQIGQTVAERDKTTGRAARSVEEVDGRAGVFGVIESKHLGQGPLILNAQQGIEGKSGDVVRTASTAIASRFNNLHKAFKFADTDNDGMLNREEIRRVLQLWNVPIDEGELDTYFAQCDADGNGNISYAEFASKMAR